MELSPNVVIVMARCRRSRQSFGIRMEEKAPRLWLSDWAFVVREDIARREGYDRATVTGSFEIDDAYPGCPSCGDKDWFKCGCGRVACWAVGTRTVQCPWCGWSGTVSGKIDQRGVGGDR